MATESLPFKVVHFIFREKHTYKQQSHDTSREVRKKSKKVLPCCRWGRGPERSRDEPEVSRMVQAALRLS